MWPPQVPIGILEIAPEPREDHLRCCVSASGLCLVFRRAAPSKVLLSPAPSPKQNGVTQQRLNICSGLGAGDAVVGKISLRIYRDQCRMKMWGPVRKGREKSVIKITNT